MSIPTMIVFQDGKPVKQIVGAKPKAALLARPGRLPGLIQPPLPSRPRPGRPVSAMPARRPSRSTEHDGTGYVCTRDTPARATVARSAAQGTMAAAPRTVRPVDSR